MRRSPLILLCLPQLHAAEPTRGVDVELIPAVEAIAPGSTFTVGLKIDHHPKFHTYWKNPGLAGVPTTLDWDLPEGFEAGPIRWPVPEMSMMAVYPVFGYERDVTLLVDLTAPADLDSGEITLRATAAWMACADACRPGKETFTLTLPVSGQPKPDPEVRSMFAAAEAEIPKALDGWSVEITSARDDDPIMFVIRPAAGSHPLDNLMIFSEDGQISSDPAPEIETLGADAYRVTVPRAEFGPEGMDTLPVVIVADTSQGKISGTFNPAYPSAAGE